MSSAAIAAFLSSSKLRFLRAFRHKTVPFCPLHGHDALELVFHLGGDGEEWSPSGDRIAFEPGSISVHPYGCAHGQRTVGPGDDLCVHIATPQLLPAPFRTSIFSLQPSDPLIRQQFFALCQSAISDDFEKARRDHLARSLLSSVWAIAARRAAPDDPIDKAQQYLRAHFRELQSLDSVAITVGLGADHLRHLFKRRVGQSLLGYLTQIRMQHARELLAHSALSIDEIAHQCGYASHRHLGVLFRRSEGCAPREYRLAQRLLSESDAPKVS